MVTSTAGQIRAVAGEADHRVIGPRELDADRGATVPAERAAAAGEQAAGASGRVAGIYVGSVEMFEGLLRALEARQIDPIIDRTFGFGEAKEAYAYLASGAHFGKVVIRVD